MKYLLIILALSSSCTVVTRYGYCKSEMTMRDGRVVSIKKLGTLEPIRDTVMTVVLITKIK